MRLIDADLLVLDINADPYRTESEKSYDRCLVHRQPTVDAVEVVHGYWVKYTHSALIAFKGGTPVWADRAVYRCDHCSFGTIAKHNYCPRCGAKMDGEDDVG